MQIMQSILSRALYCLLDPFLEFGRYLLDFVFSSIPLLFLVPAARIILAHDDHSEVVSSQVLHRLNNRSRIKLAQDTRSIEEPFPRIRVLHDTTELARESAGWCLLFEPEV